MALCRSGCRVKLDRGDWTLSGFVLTSVYGRPLGGLLGLAGVPMDISFTRYGGHRYAGQCIWQKNLVQAAMVFAPFSDWVDDDFHAASPGWCNAGDYGFG